MKNLILLIAMLLFGMSVFFKDTETIAETVKAVKTCKVLDIKNGECLSWD